jgi:putative flippase GtrA
MTQVDASTSGFRNPLDVIILAIAGRFGEKSKEVERFLKFAVVGTFGAVVDFGTVTVLQATILPPIEGTLNVALAAAFAFSAAIISNFLWNRYWTYPDSRSRSIRRQLAQFTAISLVGLTARTLFIQWSHLRLGNVVMPLALPVIQNFRPGYIPSATASAKLGTYVAMSIAIVVVMFWNFFVNRRITYNDVD